MSIKLKWKIIWTCGDKSFLMDIQKKVIQRSCLFHTTASAVSLVTGETNTIRKGHGRCSGGYSVTSAIHIIVKFHIDCLLIFYTQG